MLTETMPFDAPPSRFTSVSKMISKRPAVRRVGALILGVTMVLSTAAWQTGSDSNTLSTQQSPDEFYGAQTGAGVVEVPSGNPTTVCGNTGHGPSNVGWSGPLASPASQYTYPYVWLFGPNAATYKSNANWAYIWGQQQGYAAYLERTQGQWAPDTASGTLFADVETGGNIMCGNSISGSGWDTTDGQTGFQNNVNVMQGFLAEVKALTGNPGGIYWGESTYTAITSNLWPHNVNSYVYWQAGGCAPQTSYCEFTTTTSISTAQSQYVANRCNEMIGSGEGNRVVLWQYDPDVSGTGDFDTTAAQVAGTAGDAFTPSVNGC
jgi:hypothetical protein